MLNKTVSDYNEGVAKGVDNSFCKDTRFLIPIEGPNFYVGQFKRGGYGVLGGIDINSRTEVLDVECNVIPGLYAAGNDANTVYGISYPFTLSGNTSSFAINTGRMAGQHAAEAVIGRSEFTALR